MNSSLARQAREVPLVRDAQRDEIRMIDAKLFRDAVDLAFFGRRDRRRPSLTPRTDTASAQASGRRSPASENSRATRKLAVPPNRRLLVFASCTTTIAWSCDSCPCSRTSASMARGFFR